MAYWKRIAVGSLVLLLLPLLLFVLAMGALQLAATRQYVGERLIGLANGAMDWRLVLSGYQRLNPWGVRVEHVLLYDDYDRLVVDAHGVDATIDLWQLLNQNVDIGSARVDRALLYLPMVTEPDPPEKMRSTMQDGPEDDTPSGWRVQIPRASVGDCRLDMALPIGELRAHASDVDGEFHWGERRDDSYRIVVRRAALTGDLDGQRALTAQLTASDWSSVAGGPVQLAGTLVDSPLTARARLAGVDVHTRWPQGELSLHAQKVTPKTLAVFNLEPSWLARAADLSVEVQGDQAAFAVQTAIAIDRQRIVLEGKWDTAALQLAAKVPRLQGERVSQLLPRGTLAGHAELRYPLGKDGRLEARWRQLIVSDVLIPDGKARVRKQDQRVSFDALTLAGYEQNLTVTGQLDLDSKAARAHAQLRNFDLARLRVLRGERLGGVLNGTLQLSAPRRGALQLQGKLQATRLALRGMRAERVEAQVDGSGTLQQPELSTTIKVAGLSMAQVPLQSLQLTGSVHAGKARAQLEGQGKQLKLSLALLGDKHGERYTVQGKGKLEHAGDTLGLLFQGSHDDRASTLGLSVLGSRGRAATSGAGKLDLQLQRSARGLTLDLTADDLDLAPLLALASLREQEAELDGTAHLELPARHGALDLTQALVRAELSARLPIAPLVALASPALASLSGTLQAKLRAQGTLAEPHVELEAQAEVQLPEREEQPEKVALTAAIAPDSATAEVSLSDLDGKLLTLHAELGEPPAQLLEELRSGERLPSFALTAQLEPRRLDLMQGVTAYLAGVYAFDLPIKVAGKVTLQGRDNSLEGDAALRVRLFGDAIDQSCTAGAFTDLELEARLDQGELALHATSRGDRGGALKAQLTTRFAASGASGLALEPASLELTAERILVHTLPGLCGLSAGVATGKLGAEGIGSNEPTAQAQLTIVGLAAGRAPPLDVTLEGRLTARELSAEGGVHSQQRQAARVSFQLPLQGESAVPALDLDQPARAQLKVSALPVAPFLLVGEQLGRPRGTLDGELNASGSLRSPKLDGYLELKRIGLSIASIAQPLRDVSGRIEVHGRKLSIRGLSARDADGTLRIDGYTELAEDWSGKLQLELSATRFPIRRQGEVVGELSTKAALRGQLNSQLDLTGDVRIREGRFWLTGERGGQVQSLDKHAEIHFVDARGKAEELEKAEAEAKSKAEPKRSLSLTELRVRTDKDVWFMHSDFSVQLGIDMRLLQEAGEEKLVGEVRITRGQLQLIGKPFDIQRGSVRLTGDYPPDPELELKASFEPPSGQKLFVEVHGRASSPIVTFSGAASTAEEAVAIVSGLGTPQTGAEQRAQSDARGFATNITAGLLSATARRRLGDWVPLISVQSDVTGAPAQARAGFDASKLIPPFLRPIARGAYVEGIVGNTRQTRSGTVGLGIRLEVALPRDFVSSLGYGPGPTWATDLSWVP